MEHEQWQHHEGTSVLRNATHAAHQQLRIKHSTSPPLPSSAWMLAVSQFPVMRYDAEALRTTLLQHIIVGPQDFSSSALVSLGRAGTVRWVSGLFAGELVAH